MVEGEGEVLNGGGPVGEAGEDCIGCRVHEGVTVASLGGLKSCSSSESSRSEGSESTKSGKSHSLSLP